MGIAFVTPLDKAATYVPQDVLERLGNAATKAK